MARVLPDAAALGKTFDYSVPAAMADLVEVGTEVRVPLHGRSVTGWVTALDVVPPAGVSLQEIQKVRGYGPPSSVVDLAWWARWRWAGPASAFMKTASAPRIIRRLPRPNETLAVRRTGSRSAGPQPGEGAGRPEGALGAAVSESFSGATVVLRYPPAADPLVPALAASQLLDREDRAARSSDAGVLVLVPSHESARDLSAGLRRHGVPTALLPDDWDAARAGRCVAVGTRAAAFAPLPGLRGALVLDAHDESYYEQRAPTWCAWRVVSERAKRDGVPCVLASACPTLDVLSAGRVVVPSRVAERSGWAAIEVVDRRSDDPRTGLFSERLVRLVRWAAERPSRRVLCVLNRTGRVRLLACASCGELARCERCSGALELTEEAGESELRCRRCGAGRPVLCARCGATRMKSLRIGVSRAREELEALAGVTVQEVWGERPRSQAASTEIDAQVVVGTEAVLHRSSRADAVAFLDFDSELLAPRLRASEEALSLLARASRLVSDSTEMAPASGRSPGRVLVQTRIHEHEVLSSAVTADPGRLAASELAVRRLLSLPPLTAMAVISGAGADEYGLSLRTHAPEGVEVSGPTSGTWWVKAPAHDQLCDLLAEVPRPRGRLRVEVDPLRA